jgi:hypothetical protein
MLTRDECNQWVARILDLRPHWLRYQERLPCTLGASAYDLNTGQDAVVNYIKHRNVYNPILLREFKPLYDRLLVCLGSLFSQGCRLNDKLGYPTFHVSEADSIPSTRGERHSHFDAFFHNDFYAAKLGVSPGSIPALSQFSFTLPLRMPSGGGGLYVWDFSFSDYLRAKDDGRDEPPHEMAESAAKERVTVTYEEGVVVVHKGLLLHQIMPVEDVQDGDMRITMQGHAVFTSDCYDIFW